MLEALWSVEFSSNLQIFGAGVVIFETNRVFGGDGQYYYLGSYEVKNGVMEAELEITHYSGEPYSIFGTVKNFKIMISGKLGEPVIEAQGYLVDAPDKIILLKLTKRAELP